MHICPSHMTVFPDVDSAEQSRRVDRLLKSSAATQVDGAAARASVRLNQLASHVIARDDSACPVEREQILRLLAEKAFLFTYGDDPEALGLDGTTYDECFRPNPKGLSQEWQAWKDAVLSQAYAMYQTLSCNEAVYLTLWHPNMYGEEITHVSATLIGKTIKGPEVVVSHHESIPIPAKQSYQDGRMPRSLGLRVDGYDTRRHYERISGKRLDLKDLPVVRSIALGGFPSVNFSIARDFNNAVDYHQRCLHLSRNHEADLLYAPFASREKQIPRHYYPAPDDVEIPPEKRQINTCYSAAIDLAIAARVDGYAILERTDMPQQGRQMCRIRLLSNTADMRDTDPGIGTFKSYGTKAGVNPVSDGNVHWTDFAVQGTFLQKQKESALSLTEHRKAIAFLKMLPGWLAPPQSKATL